MYNQPLVLAVDMYGCPNRCGHCWIGHMPNRRMEEGADAWIVDYFKPFFHQIAYYSWLREPDFCDDYRARWGFLAHVALAPAQKAQQNSVLALRLVGDMVG